MIMTGQIKQRVVGIVVLVFLALIILPWLFGKNETVTSAPEPEQKENPELIKEPFQQPVADTMLEKKPIRSSEPPVINTFAKDSVTPPKKETIESVQSELVDAKSSPKPVKKKTIKPVSAPLALKSPNLEKIKIPASKVTTKKPPSNSGEKNWTIQLGSFSNKSNAEKLLKNLKAKGYSAYSKSSPGSAGEVITRVFVGPQTSHQMAEKVANKIEKSFKIQSVIVKANL